MDESYDRTFTMEKPERVRFEKAVRFDSGRRNFYLFARLILNELYFFSSESEFVKIKNGVLFNFIFGF